MAGLEGTTFGTYHLQELLGRGGMAEVYLAYDEAMDRMVAVKVMSGNGTTSLERFRREAEAIDKLQHEHILSIYDYDDQDPWHYLVMLYAPGGTLRDRLLDGPLAPEEAATMLDQIASALQHAHERGVIHRDIKPSNILLRDEHYCYLGDFGLAKVLSDNAESRVGKITQTGILMGTPEYMAPDLADGPATPSSDIYALGILLYQMITGYLPFNGETPIIVYWKQLNEAPEVPSAFNPELSLAIDRVLLRALEKDPRKRFQSAQALADAYRQALNGVWVEEEDEVIMGEVILEDTDVQEEIYPETDMPPPRRMRFSRFSRLSRIAQPTPASRQGALSRRTKNTPPIALPPLPLRTTGDIEDSGDGATQTPITPPLSRGRSGEEVSASPLRRRSRRGNKVAGIIVIAGLLLFIVLPMSIIYYLYTTHPQPVATPPAVQTPLPVTHQATASTAQSPLGGPISSISGVSGTPQLADSLASNSSERWTDDGVTCYFTNNAYHVSVKHDNFLQSCGLLNQTVGNNAVQVDISLLSGSYAGLLLRAKGDSFYIFGISNQGQYFFSRHDAGAGTNYVPLIQATSNGAILAGSAKNTLQVIAHQDTFKLFINGTFVGQAQDGTYASGQLALAAGTLPPIQASEAAFTNFKLFSA